MVMRHLINLSLLLTALSSIGCQNNVRNIPVAPDSELGRDIQQMDTLARSAQNKPVFTETLNKFARKNGEACADLEFHSLKEPGVSINGSTKAYTLVAVSPTCGNVNYHGRVIFRDASHTVVERVDLLIGPKEEAAFKQVAETFIAAAQRGQPDEMLALTSNRSYTTAGKSLKEFYQTEIIPEFKDLNVTWQPAGTAIVDQKRNVGVAFTGNASGKKNYTFRVAIYRENGKVVFASIEKVR
jgi:hypothetical protein